LEGRNGKGVRALLAVDGGVWAGAGRDVIVWERGGVLDGVALGTRSLVVAMVGRVRARRYFRVSRGGGERS
jgi:hypothetical protein